MWSGIRRRFRRHQGHHNNSPMPNSMEEIDLIDQAHQEWQAARRLFEHVNDPDLVDQAIHRMTAAEKRYVFLLKRARESGMWGKFSPPPA